MSVEAVAWALKQPVKPSAAKFVLVAMADCVNKDTFVAWPSVANLVVATCQDRKTVLANIVRLRELGYIEDTGERKGATHQIVVYRLKSPENGIVQSAEVGEEEAQFSDEKESQNRNSSTSGTVPDFPSNSPVFPSKESQISPETVPNQGHGTGIGTVKEPEGNRNKERARRAPVANAPKPDCVPQDVWDDFLSIRRAKRAPLTATALKGLEREAEKAGWTLERAIAKCCERGWQGFEAAWLQREQSPAGKPAPGKHTGFGERTYVGTDANAIEWAN